MGSAHQRQGCHLDGWSHAPVALSAQPTGCTQGCPQPHLPHAHFHSIASAHAVSPQRPCNDVFWLLRPQHHAVQLVEDRQRQPRFACSRPCRQNQEHRRQKSACKDLTYSPAFQATAHFMFSHCCIGARSTKTQLIPPARPKFPSRHTILSQAKNFQTAFHSALVRASCGSIFILGETALSSLAQFKNEL